TRRPERDSRAAGDRRPGRVPLGARETAAQGARRAGAPVLGGPAGGRGRGGPRLLGGHRQEHRIPGSGPARRDPPPPRARRRAAPGPARRLSHHEERHVMITDELEQELRSVLAKSAEGTPLSPQARQRLLQRNYHPRRVNRGLAAGLATATVAAGAVAAAGGTVPLTADGGAPPAAPGAGIQLAPHSLHMPPRATLTAPTPPPRPPAAPLPLTDAQP